MQWVFIENMVLYVVCGATIVSLYYLGAGGHSFWALAMLMFVNSFKSKKD